MLSLQEVNHSTGFLSYSVTVSEGNTGGRGAVGDVSCTFLSDLEVWEQETSVIVNRKFLQAKKEKEAEKIKTEF